MPSWLVDDPTEVLLVLALFALALGVFWWVRRGDDFGKKKLSWLKGLKARRLTRNQCCAMGLTLIGFLALVVVLISLLVVTDPKRIRRAIQEMSDGVKEGNLDKIFSHVSDQFRLMGQSKESYRPTVERYIRNGDLTAISVWDFDEAQVSREKKEATIEFRVKPKGTMTGAELFYLCRATFSLDSDGKWRLKTFVVSEPHVDPKSRHVIYPP